MTPAPADPIAAVLEDMRSRTAAGQTVRADDYLHSGDSTSVDQEHLLDLIYAEFLMRLETDSPLSADDCAARFPRLGDRIRRLFRVHDALDSPTVSLPRPVGATGARVSEEPPSSAGTASSTGSARAGKGSSTGASIPISRGMSRSKSHADRSVPETSIPCAAKRSCSPRWTIRTWRAFTIWTSTTATRSR